MGTMSMSALHGRLCRSHFTSFVLWGIGAQIGALVYYFVYFRSHGYLPAPFIYDKHDTFMDLYNPLWWADEPGKYSVWQSVYPPINFLILDRVKWIFFGGANVAEPFELRDINLWPAYAISACYLIVPFAVAASAQWRETFDVRTRLMIAAFAAMSAPFLFSLERGNLIILALLVLPAIFSRGMALQIIGVALLINIKPYFALLLLGYVIRREPHMLVAAVTVSAIVFVATGLLCDPDFPLFLTNLFHFSQNETVLSGREVLAFPSSVSAFSYAINIAMKGSGEGGAAITFFSTVALMIEVAKWSAILLLLSSIVFAGEKIGGSEVHVAMIAIFISMGVWAGGYSQIFYLACVPTLVRMRCWFIHILLLFIIFLPIDCITMLEQRLGLAVSFLQGEIIELDWQLGLGSFVRPAANLLLVVSLGVEFLARMPEYLTSFPISKTVPSA